MIHTVGPIARGHLTDTHKENLANCYKSSLKLAKENNIRSLVSTLCKHVVLGRVLFTCYRVIIEIIRGFQKKFLLACDTKKQEVIYLAKIIAKQRRRLFYKRVRKTALVVYSKYRCTNLSPIKVSSCSRCSFHTLIY